MITTLLLIGAGTASGAGVGLLVAFLAAPLPESAAAFAIPTLGAGLILDTLVLVFGTPLPPGSGRQVPQEWSRLFPAPVVAVLYGARLGVGPLTILSTWTWWSVTIAAVLAGPWSSVAVGACFGFVRLISTVGASLLSSPAPRQERPQPRHVEWFGRLRSLQRPNWIMLNGAGLLALSMFLFAACGTEQPEQTASTTVPDRAIANEATESDVGPVSGLDAGPEFSPSLGGEPDDDLITPVELEDVVRTATEKNLTSSGQASAPRVDVDLLPNEAQTAEAVAVADAPASSAPDALAKALMENIEGFQPVDDPMANRFLDITAASEIQPDPTEEIALLETRGFEGGWTRAFRNERNDVAVTSVYQFEDAAEAEFYLEDGLITIGGYGGKFFDIDELPGVRGFVQYFTETNADGAEELVSLGAAFQAGPRWFLVYFVGSVDTVTPEVLIPAITAQRQAA